LDTLLLFVTQATLSLVSFGLIAIWVIYPRLRVRRCWALSIGLPASFTSRVPSLGRQTPHT
jgi:hypothetical protein